MATIDQTARPPETPSDDNLKHVLETARTALEHELRRADSLDTKARGQATLAGSLLVITQAVALLAIRSKVGAGWVIPIGVLLAAQAAAFGLLLWQSAKVW